jgi:hypothetical protein
MSTVSLPTYTVADLQTPSYNAEPLLHETSLAHGRRPSGAAFAQTHPHAFAETAPLLPASASAEFVKVSRRGSLRLRLQVSAEAADGGETVAVPVFGARGPVEGSVELLKPLDLAYVAVRVRGFFPLRRSPTDFD